MKYYEILNESAGMSLADMFAKLEDGAIRGRILQGFRFVWTQEASNNGLFHLFTGAWKTYGEDNDIEVSISIKFEASETHKLVISIVPYEIQYRSFESPRKTPGDRTTDGIEDLRHTARKFETSIDDTSKWLSLLNSALQACDEHILVQLDKMGKA